MLLTSSAMFSRNFLSLGTLVFQAYLILLLVSTFLPCETCYDLVLKVVVFYVVLRVPYEHFQFVYAFQSYLCALFF